MKKPIIIIGAMDGEIDFLIKKLKNTKKIKLNIYNVYIGNIKDYPVIVAQSDVGIINASILATLIVDKHNPLLIINEGTAGGYSKNIHRGDIVIGSECFNIMSAKTPYKEEKEGSNSIEWDYISFTNGRTDQKDIKKADERLIDFIEKRKGKYNLGHIHTGVIGSGDIWNCEKDKIKYLHKTHNVLCEDMETIAVYSVATNYNIPVIGIRMISNNLILGEDYNKNLGLECQKFIYKIIEDLIEEINIF